MNLYQIDEAILNCVDVETGEIFDEAMFEELSMSRDAKIENICLWIKNLDAEEKALKAEKDAFEQRRKAAATRRDDLKKYISGYLEGTPYKSAKVAVSFRKSEAVEIDDVYALPEEFLKYKEPEADKTALKKALKEGAAISGCHIVNNLNIQIK